MLTRTLAAPLRFAAAEPTEVARLASCRLRTWQAKDVSSICAHLSDQTMWGFFAMPFPGAWTEAHAEHYLATLTTKPDTFFFAAALLDTDEAVGGICGELGTGPHRRSAELGGWLARPYWRSGIARDVTTAFADWLFDTHDVLRVHAAPYHPNRASIGTLRASGFSFEGRLKCSVVKDGRVMDQMQYAKINPKHSDTR
jgi:[ribosomal protein S5]-alanine N-acetyltransferase